MITASANNLAAQSLGEPYSTHRELAMAHTPQLQA